MAGRGLGTLTLDLVLKMGGFTAGLDKAGRELDTKTKAMHRRMEAFGRQIGTALKVGFGVGVAALGLYVKNTIEAEKVQAQLAARIRDTGNAASRTLQQLNEQANKLQTITIFDDEAIGEAQARLLTFTNVVGENFDRTIEAATDLATVMGTDVTDAARLLGKALSDPVAGMGALRKAGIVLSEQQKGLIKDFQESGDIIGAQDVILRQLEDTMGSAAEAARDTLGGALQGLKNSFNEMLEGDNGSDGARGAKEAINQLADTMNSAQVKEGFNTILAGLADITTYMLNAIGTAGKFSQSLQDAFTGTAGKSYDGLLTHRRQLLEDIAEAEKGTYSAAKQMWFGRDAGDVGENNFSVFESAAENAARMRKELELVNERLERLRTLQNTVGAPGSPASQNIFAPDGNIRITADPDEFGSRPDRSGANSAKAEAERLAREQARAAQEAKEANEEFLAGLQDMRDELAGPLAQALTEHNRKLAELQELAAKGKIGADDLKAAQEAETELYERRRIEIEKTLNPLARVVEQQEKELALLGLTGTALEAEAIRLDSTAEQWAKYGDAITANIEKRAETEQAIAAADQFRSHWEDAFSAIFDGSKSVGEAFSDLAKSILADIARMLAKQWVEQLFGAYGTSGGGGSGAGVVSAFASLFGGGRDEGGPVSHRRFYEVGEHNQPEIFKSGHRTYLIPGNDGAVSPMGAAAGFQQHIHYSLQGRPERKTREQLEASAARAGMRAMRRGG